MTEEKNGTLRESSRVAMSVNLMIKVVGGTVFLVALGYGGLAQLKAVETSLEKRITKLESELPHRIDMKVRPTDLLAKAKLQRLREESDTAESDIDALREQIHLIKKEVVRFNPAAFEPERKGITGE